MNLTLFKLGSGLFISLFLTGMAAKTPELPQFVTLGGMIASGIIVLLTIRKLWYEGSNKRLDAKLKEKELGD